MPSEERFIHLRTHSAYSLAEGAIKVKDVVKLCKHHNMPAVAVTDTNNMFGALEFAMEAAKNGVQPIIGAQVRMGLEGHQLVLLCKNEAGYLNLSRLVSGAYLDSDPAHEPCVEWEALEKQAEGLICLTGSTPGPVNQFLLHNQAKEAEKALKKLQKIFPDTLYIELQRHGLPEEDNVEEALIDLAYKYDVPLVATNDCYFADKAMHEAHDALLCIAGGRYVTEDDRRKVTPEHAFKPAAAMRALFEDIPEAVDNTVVIAQRCGFLLEGKAPILPAFPTEEGRTEEEELEAQSKKGLEWRLENFLEDGADPAPYRERLDYELNVIREMGFPGYFLIVSDFIKWAKEQNIPVGPGRGSGAGSVVAWALQITDLDPLRFGLLFERFLNPERVSMPDFDVDFCQERRDEVIQYVLDRYGSDRVAHIITFGTLQARAVVRDTGRVLQMPYGQVDRIAKMIPNNPAAPTTLQEALDQDADLRAEVAREETSQKLINIALKLEGLFRHASTHAAGVVIGDRPLPELIPLYRDPRSVTPATQFNMKYTEEAGLVKFDFLGLKTMTVIQKTVDLLAAQGTVIDIYQLPLDDKGTYELLSAGTTTGVFQLESGGMRDAMRKMKPDCFEDIIALVSLYRPGPMENIPRYIAVKNGQETPDYMHEKLEPLLKETCGIMIYQEQVMQAAQSLAGYTLGSADLLRRAMGKKIQSEMDAQREMFVTGCAEHSKIDEGKANAIFDQIAKFAGYGFNKSHAAAYALIAYWTAYFKANYPVEFMAASMTLDLHNTDKLAVFKQELDRMNITLLPPDVNRSLPVFKVEGDAIRYALAALKGVGEQAMERLVEECKENGPFASLQDFAERIDPQALNRRQIEQLGAAGAFDTLEKNRARSFGAAETLLRHAQTAADDRESGQVSLFGGGDGDTGNSPPLDIPGAEPWDSLETLKREFEAVGFYLSAHPLDSKAGALERAGVVLSAGLEDRLTYTTSASLSMAGVLIRKQIKVSPKTKNKYAFLHLSDSSGVYEITLFSEQLAAANDLLEPGHTLFVKVVAEQREDQIRLTAQDIKPLEEALSGKVTAIHIEVEAGFSAASLKEVLEGERPGNVAVNVQTPLARLALPGRYGFSPKMREGLLKMGGVVGVNER